MKLFRRDRSRPLPSAIAPSTNKRKLPYIKAVLGKLLPVAWGGKLLAAHSIRVIEPQRGFGDRDGGSDHGEDWASRTQAALQPYETAPGLSPEQTLEQTMSAFLDAVESFYQDGLVIGGYCLMRDCHALTKGEDLECWIERLLPIMDRVIAQRESKTVGRHPLRYNDINSDLIRMLAANFVCANWLGEGLRSASPMGEGVAQGISQLAIALVAQAQPNATTFHRRLQGRLHHDRVEQVVRETMAGAETSTALRPADIDRTCYLLINVAGRTDSP